MVLCPNCKKSYDETLAAGVCPHCGYESPDLSTDTRSLFLFQEDVPQETNSAASPVDAGQSVSTDGNTFSDPRWLPPGTILHQCYEIKKVIGAGGFGITYLAIDQKTGVPKAIKEYFQQGVVNRIPGTTEVFVAASKRREEFEYGRSRLLREAQIVAKFQSRNIVRVDAYFQENNTAYMVMEYLTSPTLQDLLLTNKRVLSAEEAVQIGVKLCSALEEIHQAGVLHRDIAPDNIHVGANGEVKIIDFGSARLSKEDTDDRLIVLKPGYAPPEQYEKIDPNNDRQQAWTDVYALGATLYAALTGTRPAEASDRKADFDRKSDRVCDPKQINPNIPDFLNNTIMTAMAINLHERFQSAAEFKAALMQERQVLPLETVRKKKRLKRSVSIAGSLCLIAVLVFAGIHWYGTRKENALLDPATVSIWYSLSGSEDIQAQKSAAMDAILDEIRSSDIFAQVEIEAKAIPEAEYHAALETALASGQIPTLFEAPDTTYSQNTQSVEAVLSSPEAADCAFLKSCQERLLSEKRVPTGFSIPVVYVNTSLITTSSEIVLSSMEEFLKLDNGDLKYKPMASNPADLSAFTSALPGFSAYADTVKSYTKKDFLSEKAIVYFSDTSDYYDVRASLPGRFQILPLAETSIPCQFTNYWSIGSTQENDTAAAAEILSYFLSNYAQDQYYLQTNAPGLPLEESTLSAYAEVRPVFADLLTDLSAYTFERT